MCALESHSLECQLLHEWRHIEVSADVHQEEGGTGALTEGAEDWGGQPHTQCLPRMITGGCDSSPEKGQRGPEALLNLMAGPLDVHLEL